MTIHTHDEVEFLYLYTYKRIFTNYYFVFFHILERSSYITGLGKDWFLKTYQVINIMAYFCLIEREKYEESSTSILASFWFVPKPTVPPA